jgi:hypothetical protein
MTPTQQAQVVKDCGGHLVTLSFRLPAIPPPDNGGCGEPTHVAGTNAGRLPCGALFNWPGEEPRPYYCAPCSQRHQRNKHLFL